MRKKKKEIPSFYLLFVTKDTLNSSGCTIIFLVRFYYSIRNFVEVYKLHYKDMKVESFHIKFH